jgi:hypothetical protein
VLVVPCARGGGIGGIASSVAHVGAMGKGLEKSELVSWIVGELDGELVN